MTPDQASYLQERIEASIRNGYKCSDTMVAVLEEVAKLECSDDTCEDCIICMSQDFIGRIT